MTLTKQLAGISLAALLAVATSAAFAEDGKYVQNSAGEAVKNSAGECVLAQFGSSPEGCEVAPPPVKTTPVKPVPPKPVVRPAPPKKPYVPKPKVKGNYRGPVAVDPASREALQQYKR